VVSLGGWGVAAGSAPIIGAAHAGVDGDAPLDLVHCGRRADRKWHNLPAPLKLALVASLSCDFDRGRGRFWLHERITNSDQGAEWLCNAGVVVQSARRGRQFAPA
jgi:hypothetical protein